MKKWSELTSNEKVIVIAMTIGTIVSIFAITQIPGAL